MVDFTFYTCDNKTCDKYNPFFYYDAFPNIWCKRNHLTFNRIFFLNARLLLCISQYDFVPWRFLLVIALWELLNNEKFKFVWLMAAGLFACFYTTCCNLFFFSTVLATFDYGIDRSVLVSNKEVPMVILGFGTVTSVVFLFIAMIKTIGKMV